MLFDGLYDAINRGSRMFGPRCVDHAQMRPLTRCANAELGYMRRLYVFNCCEKACFMATRERQRGNDGIFDFTAEELSSCMKNEGPGMYIFTCCTSMII